MTIETPILFYALLATSAALVFLFGFAYGSSISRKAAHYEFNRIVRAGYMVVDGRTYRMLDITGDGKADLNKAADDKRPPKTSELIA